MLIDWFTVGAQALNFVILVWLMKRFLYKPVLLAIDTREKRIAAELADADAKKAAAERARDDFQHKNDDFDKQRSALLAKATDDAKSERDHLIGAARDEADALAEKRKVQLRDDADELGRALRLKAQQEVFAIARKTLKDLATTSLEERMDAEFTRRLREMDGDAKARLTKALRELASTALVRSAFDVPPERRAALQSAVNETFSTSTPLTFETNPELVGGIELSAGGQKVAWSISNYLTALEQRVGELLNDNDKPKSNATPTPKPKTGPKPETRTEPTPEGVGGPKPKTGPKFETRTEPMPEGVGGPKQDGPKSEGAHP